VGPPGHGRERWWRGGGLIYRMYFSVPGAAGLLRGNNGIHNYTQKLEGNDHKKAVRTETTEIYVYQASVR